MLKVSLVVLVGLPASGKSTLCQKLTDKVILDDEKSENNSHSSETNKHSYYIHICYDDLIPLKKQEQYAEAAELTASKQWRQARDDVYNIVESLLQIVKSSEVTSNDLFIFCHNHGFSTNFVESTVFLATSHVVLLLDDNFYYESMRHPFHQLSYRYGTGYCELHISCTLDDAKTRNDSRSDECKVPNLVIEKMSSRLEPPNKSHPHLWCKNDDDLKFICEFINISWSDWMDKIKLKRKLAVEASESRLLCSQNVLHQADISLRSFVSEAIKSPDECIKSLKKSELSKGANRARKDVFERLKNGSLPSTAIEQLNSNNDKAAIDDCLREYFCDALMSNLKRVN